MRRATHEGQKPRALHENVRHDLLAAPRAREPHATVLEEPAAQVPIHLAPPEARQPAARHLLAALELRMLLEDSLDTARAYVTNAPIYTADEIARLYDKRAGIEPVFADLKGHWTLGACMHDFDATEAWMLLKLIAQNALTLYAQTRCAPIARWAAPSLRAVLLHIPGRIVRSARQLTLKLALRPLLTDTSTHPNPTRCLE